MSEVIDKLELESDEETEGEVTRADHISGPPQGSWAYKDYVAIPDDGKHYEIIEGVLYLMPSPSFKHQDALGGFIQHLRMVHSADLGRVIAAPFDVELPSGNVVQPDVIVVLKANRKIIKRGKILGAPDLVIEISSPGTAAYDKNEKLQSYAANGVKEYWVVKPSQKTVEVLILEDGQYQSLGVFKGTQTVTSKILPDLPVPVKEFFA